MAFPLFTLPAIPWILVLKSMDSRGLFVTSLASKRTQSLVKLALKHELLTADVTVLDGKILLKRGSSEDPQTGKDNVSVIAMVPAITWGSVKYSKVFGNQSIMISQPENDETLPILFHCDDPYELMRRTIRHLDETFFKLVVKVNQVRAANWWMWSFAKLEYGSVNISKDLFIKLFVDCKRVHFEKADFNNEELSDIFNHWVQGPNMVYLELKMTDKNDLGEVLKNVEGVAPAERSIEEYFDSE